jgi:hypothetical protein
VKTEPLMIVDASAMVEAVSKLVALLNCGNPRVEVTAAHMILALSNRFIEDDLKARVSLLESGLRGA